jgi:hypothetical protein
LPSVAAGTASLTDFAIPAALDAPLHGFRPMRREVERSALLRQSKAYRSRNTLGINRMSRNHRGTCSLAETIDWLLLRKNVAWSPPFRFCERASLRAPSRTPGTEIGRTRCIPRCEMSTVVFRIRHNW